MEKLENYKFITTDDGSVTVYSERYAEACHSTSGAITETQTHYLGGCKIAELSQELESVNILEVGFGVGIGFLETLKLTQGKTFLNFHSFEIDDELIEYVLKKNKLEFNKSDDFYNVTHDDYTLTIWRGNARESIKKLILSHVQKFHAIYQDAFSPKRNAILWTTEWFLDLKELSLPNCILSTYSASSSIRKSLIAAGWGVTKGVKFGPKRSSTRASLNIETDQDIKEQLQRSPAPELTDDNYQDYHLKG